jgi:hypothetical protein
MMTKVSNLELMQDILSEYVIPVDYRHARRLAAMRVTFDRYISHVMDHVVSNPVTDSDNDWFDDMRKHAREKYPNITEAEIEMGLFECAAAAMDTYYGDSLDPWGEDV